MIYIYDLRNAIYDLGKICPAIALLAHPQDRLRIEKLKTIV
jgi:hypothetical protein